MPMLTRRTSTLLLSTLLASSTLLITPAQAHDMNDVLAGGVGAITGAVIGQAVGGKNGTVIGAAIGGAVGVTVAQSDRRVVRQQPVTIVQPMPAQPVQYVYAQPMPPMPPAYGRPWCPPRHEFRHEEPRFHHHGGGWRY
ncbi:hypothetical protein KIK84_08010 [Curvibacter sp. CHRR-16]|uniref:glycine zipper domain-containing protein n=1 Tax=Curvibacter sp. CHRR-16 TaxID=2835872 RepID=UPI001BD9C835|nr:glycine zipper family protein [Curvibacter sp. CHRR-16]MBT0570267.1 hypothetical protein [Curvibacter sp. CHRR-16]